LYVEVGDVEDLMLVHEGLGVGSWWSVHDVVVVGRYFIRDENRSKIREIP
jgi:hypothetical protein